ncbi:tRNA-binding protein Pbp11 [Thermococcus sp.]
MGILDRFRKKTEEVEIVSRRPVGRFKVIGTTNILGKQVLGGIVLDGIIHPGYKLKDGGIALVREIHIQNRKVDFVVEHDEAALVLEGTLRVKEGEIIEVYQS